MKKLIVPAFVLAMTVTTISSKAQTATPATQVVPQADKAVAAEHAQAQQEAKTQVDLNALPDGIKKTLASDNYKEWTAASAWQVKSNGSDYYLVEMKKGEETTTIKVDANGKIVG